MQISNHQTLGTLHRLPGTPAHILQKKGMRHHFGDLSSNQGLPGWSAGRMLSPSQMAPFGLGQEQKKVTIDNMNVRINFEAHFCNSFFFCISSKTVDGLLNCFYELAFYVCSSEKHASPRASITSWCNSFSKSLLHCEIDSRLLWCHVWGDKTISLFIYL